MEQWLDHQAEVRWLEIPDVARSVMETIHGYEERNVWEMHEYVIMPTHAHLFFEFREGAAAYRDDEGKTLDNFMDCFKRLSGRRANSILSRCGEKFWQREWFDRWVRNQTEAEKVIRYIQNNPVKAGLVGRSLDWPFGRWAVRKANRE
jgi:REP element-mobilizing transposase RayT